MALDIGGRGKTADLVAHHRLHVVGNARNREHVLQLGRQRGIGIGRVGVVLPGFLGRLSAEEGCIVSVLAMHQRNEAEIAQRFPQGYRAVKPYLRLTPQPNR